jgi:intracellular sulfur oxidation DsrE/DsrF family protein
MEFSSFQPVEAAVTLSVIWIGLGGAGLALARAPRVVTDWVFPAGAAEITRLLQREGYAYLRPRKW